MFFYQSNFELLMEIKIQGLISEEQILCSEHSHYVVPLIVLFTFPLCMARHFS